MSPGPAGEGLPGARPAEERPGGDLRTIRLLLAYDGTDFSGWERQTGPQPRPVRTVQGELEAALAVLHKGGEDAPRVVGAGRTDAGVHAAGQVAHFPTTLRTMEARRFVPALNRLLPRDVRVLEARDARPGFHARFDALSRTYRYYFIAGRPALPWELRYAWLLHRRPRLDLLNRYAALLRGERDCGIFAAAADKSRSRRRRFDSAAFFPEGDKLVFEITANAFLWRMARSLAGTLLHYESRGLPPEELDAIIASGDRRLAGPTAPPQGLFLWTVAYPPGDAPRPPQPWER